MTKERFLRSVGNWNNHLYLLWEALEASKYLKLPVLELGCGDGSTPYLLEYCKANKLELISYDYNKEWADKYNAIHIEDWDTLDWAKEYGCVLVDESPGEQRKFSLQRLHHAKIIVAHDTEPPADHGYQMREELAKYKYMVDFGNDGAWATCASNFIDVGKFKV